VVIDAGHQKKGDSSLEPVGPGASEKKAKVAGGARGVSTGNPEGAITLEIAKRLRDELEVRGVKVIMVRTKQDVNIANSKRAKIANDARADLFIRLHGDGASSSSARGLSTLIPGKNEWTGPILAESKKAGAFVHEAVIASTGANDRGLKKRSDLSGFNWSKVPTVLVEMGFMSNPAEDRKLASSEYQTKLAKGMAAGIMKYLESK
jgi:N-acetylmuramoyl-L-alanine amidase